jgi:hypothetical protein
MSLYREVRRPTRWVAAALALVLVVGLGAGWAAGRATAPEPSLADALAKTRNQVSEVLAGLDLVGIEYSQGTVEPAAALAAAERARESFSGVEDDLAALDAAATEQVESLLAELERLIADRAPEARVQSAAEQAADELRAIVGP